MPLLCRQEQKIKATITFLNGKKIFITNAKEASIFLVFANVNPAAGYKGITCFVVDKGRLA